MNREGTAMSFRVKRLWVMVFFVSLCLIGCEEDSRAIDDKPDLGGLRNFLVLIAGACLLLGILGLVIRSAVWGKQNQKESSPQPSAKRTIGIGVQKFRIEGVDRETKMDTIWHVDATSEANAKVKAELEGIIVTGITPED